MRLGNHNSLKEQSKYWILAWVSLAQECVVILSLGFVCPDWRGKLLFSEWMEQ